MGHYTEKNVREFQETLGFLNSYDGNDSGNDEVFTDDGKRHNMKTQLLAELGNINKQRQHLIELLTK